MNNYNNSKCSNSNNINNNKRHLDNNNIKKVLTLYIVYEAVIKNKKFINYNLKISKYTKQ